MSFSINNDLSFIDSFQFLSSSLELSQKDLARDDFRYLSQELDNNVLDLVKQNSYKDKNDVEKLKEKSPSKERFYSSLRDKKISDKEYEHVLKVWNKFEMKTMKDYHDLYLKCDVLLLADVFQKFRKNSLKENGLCSSHYLSVGMQCLI